MSFGRRVRVLLALAASSGLLGCVEPDPGDDSDCEAPRIVTVTADHPLRAAPETLLVGKRSVFLAPSLWRDFMPVAPPDGREMIALVRLVAADSLAFPAGLDADTLWVVDGEKAWRTRLAADLSWHPEYELAKIARCGPKWEPGRTVDVVVSVREEGEPRRLLRAAKQRIERTE